MINPGSLALAQKLKNIVDICEAADVEIENQKLIQKGALDAGKENDGIEPSVVRKILARRKRLAKDPAETTRLEDLMTDYQFMLGEGREDTRPWTQVDDEVSRVMALTNTSRPPKIEAIKKALGCSQGKAHKLRSIAAVRLAKKSSSSPDAREHEHLPAHDADGVIIENQEVDLSGDDAGYRSEPSEPAGQPVNASPPPAPEGLSIVGQGPRSGTHSGIHEDAERSTESCGGGLTGPDRSPEGAQDPALVGVTPGPHDTPDSLSPGNGEPATIGANEISTFGPDSASQPVTLPEGGESRDGWRSGTSSDDDLDALMPPHLRRPKPARMVTA